MNKLRLKPGGSHGGHNGLFDIQAIMDSDKFPRLRFGLGNNFPRGMQSEFVLGKWFPEERNVVNQKIEASVEVIENIAVIGIEKTMNTINNIEFKG